MSIFNFQNDLCDRFDAWENIVEHFNCYVSDDEVWEIARTYEKPPLIANIYQFLLIEKVVACFMEATGLTEDEFTYWTYINSLDTWLSINDVSIDSEDVFFDLVEKLKVD